MDVYTEAGLDLSKSDLMRYALGRGRITRDGQTFIDWVMEDFEMFANATLNIELRPPQKEIGRAILESVLYKQGREIVVEMSRQSGKSTLVSLIVTYLCYNIDKFYRMNNLRGGTGIEKVDIKVNLSKTHFKTLVFGPKLAQAQIIGQKVRDIIMSLNELGAEVELVTKQHIKVQEIEGNWSQIFMESANSSASIEGLTGNLIIIDEAQAVDDTVMKKSIFPMGSQTRATRVLIGTPSLDLRTSRYFFERIVEDDDNEDDTFIYDYEINQEYSDDYRHYIEDLIRNIGEDSLEFKTQYKLEWLEQEAKYIDKQSLLACCSNRRCIPTLIHDNHTGIELRNIVVGIDVGKKADSTVATVAQVYNAPDIDGDTSETGAGFKLRILDWFESQTTDYHEIIQNIYKFMSNYALRVCVVDAVGVGDTFFDILKSEWRRHQRNGEYKHHSNLKFEPFQWSRKNHHKLFTKLHTIIKMQRLDYPGEETLEKKKFERQFNLLTRDVRGNMLKTDHPPGEHDDYCSSLALVVHAAGISYKKNEAKAGKKSKSKKRYSIPNPMRDSNSPAFKPRDKMFKNEYIQL